MPRHHQALTDGQRWAFSVLMRTGRKSSQLSLESAAAATFDVLMTWQMEDLAAGMEDYVRWLESGPPTPLANPHRLSAALTAYSLCWPQVLDVLGVERSVTLAAPVTVLGDHRESRRQPSTVHGISHLPCNRCGQPASRLWQICADGGAFRPLCARCDADLNELALQFVGDPEASVKAAGYRDRVGVV